MSLLKYSEIIKFKFITKNPQGYLNNTYEGILWNSLDLTPNPTKEELDTAGDALQLELLNSVLNTYNSDIPLTASQGKVFSDSVLQEITDRMLADAMLDATKQPLSAALTAIDALNGVESILYRNAEGIWTLLDAQAFAATIPWYTSGTTLERVIPTSGSGFRFNTDTAWFEGYNGANWFSLGGTPLGSLFVLDYTAVGAIAEPITSILTTLPPTLPNGTTADYSGIWASTLVVPSANLAITSLTFNNLQGLTGTLSINGLTALSFMHFPALTTVMGGFAISSLAGLTNITCPLLTYVGTNFSIGNNIAFPTIMFPVLATVDGNFTLTELAGCTSVNFPLLTAVGGNFNVSSLPVCVAANFNTLTEIKGKLNISLSPALTTLSFSSLEHIGTNLTVGNAINIGPTMTGLTIFELSNNLKQVNGSVYINCAMSAVAIDNFLTQLARLDGLNGTVAFSNKSITITGPSAAPSTVGLDAKAILVGRGCTVTTN